MVGNAVNFPQKNHVVILLWRATGRGSRVT
jgi:hypothetical protein